MELDAVLAEAQRRCDVVIGEPARQHLQDFHLPRGQRRRFQVRGDQVLDVGRQDVAARQHVVERLDEVGV